MSFTPSTPSAPRSLPLIFTASPITYNCDAVLEFDVTLSVLSVLFHAISNNNPNPFPPSNRAGCFCKFTVSGKIDCEFAGKDSVSFSPADVIDILVIAPSASTDETVNFKSVRYLVSVTEL